MEARFVGKCIYCFSGNASINEHVPPKSLGGTTTLQKASCEKCADRTGQIIEKMVSGTSSLLGRSRIILGMPSRRARERPTRLKQIVRHKDTRNVEKVDVSVSDFIDVVFLPLFPLPGIMMGKKIMEGIITEGFQSINVNKKKVEKGKEYLHKVEIASEDFALLLALIGYSGAVLEFDFDNVKDSPLVPIILGEKKDFGTWIGMAQDNIMRKDNKFLGIWRSQNNEHFAMRIKFFTWVDNMPEYIVVVK